MEGCDRFADRPIDSFDQKIGWGSLAGLTDSCKGNAVKSVPFKRQPLKVERITLGRGFKVLDLLMGVLKGRGQDRLSGF